MQQPNIILRCYAKLINFVFQTKTLCNAIWNNHMSFYTVMQIGKYLRSKPQQVHIVCILKLTRCEIEILRNTKFWVTHRCPSHRCLMRRGTPLTRSWFMLALNIQRFATVLTHQLTCFSHAEYHYCVTVYQSDVKFELHSVYMENLKFTGFTLFSQTHTSIDMHSSCRIPLLCDCLSIWCAIWAKKCLQSEHLRVLLSPPKSYSKWLTHPSTCVVHTEYHYCVTVCRSDVQCELQSDYNFDTYGF